MTQYKMSTHFQRAVDFSKLSTTHLLTDPIQHLHELRDTFINIQPSGEDSLVIEPDRQPRSADRNASKLESDEEILWPKVTKEEVVPNGPDPVVPLILREPDMHIQRCCRSEVE